MCIYNVYMPYSNNMFKVTCKKHEHVESSPFNSPFSNTSQLKLVYIA